MEILFWVKLISAFIVGGGFIALLSFIAERSGSKVSGIVLAFPSTVALGFFFLGWVHSPATVVQVILATFIPLGLAVLYPVIYVYFSVFLSHHISSRIIQIVLSLLVCTIIWFLLALPIILFEHTNLLVGIAGYLLLAGFSHLLIFKKKNYKPRAVRYSFYQKLGRAAFVGFIIMLVVLLSEILNPFWGGVMSMFPAAFLSTLMVLHYYRGAENLRAIISMVAVGSLSIFVYALVAMKVFPVAGIVWGTIISMVSSLVTSFILSKIRI